VIERVHSSRAVVFHTDREVEDCQTVFEEVMPERCAGLKKGMEEEGEAAREVVVSPSMTQGMGVRAELSLR
jgi:hypothetical protein